AYTSMLSAPDTDTSATVPLIFRLGISTWNTLPAGGCPVCCSPFALYDACHLVSEGGASTTTGLFCITISTETVMPSMSLENVCVNIFDCATGFAKRLASVLFKPFCVIPAAMSKLAIYYYLCI